MEIRNNNLNARPKEGFNFDPTKANREAIENHQPEPVTDLPVKDEVQVSRAAQEALAREVQSERADGDQQRIDELKRLHDEGALNTPERIEQSANRMLLGE